MTNREEIAADIWRWQQAQGLTGAMPHHVLLHRARMALLDAQKEIERLQQAEPAVHSQGRGMSETDKLIADAYRTVFGGEPVQGDYLFGRKVLELVHQKDGLSKETKRLIEILQSGIDDPMWACHFEINKATAKAIIRMLGQQG